MAVPDNHDRHRIQNDIDRAVIAASPYAAEPVDPAELKRWQDFFDKALGRDALAKAICKGLTGFETLADYERYGECFLPLRASDYDNPELRPFLVPRPDPNK